MRQCNFHENKNRGISNIHMNIDLFHGLYKCQINIDVHSIRKICFWQLFVFGCDTFNKKLSFMYKNVNWMDQGFQ